MKFLIVCITMLLISGCSGAKIADNITNTQIAMSGNNPPAFFTVANAETMRDYVFETDDFSFKFPIAKQTDFSKMGGWSGMSMRDGKTIAFGFKNSIVYHIAISTSGKVRPYTERDRELENGTRKFSSKRRTSRGRIININVHKEYYGEENYPCVVSESKIPYGKIVKKEKYYSCYKFNPSHTKSKSVSITLTYNKPNDPTLAKEYTYEDLKNRAKRMLDSLYIKDEW